MKWNITAECISTVILCIIWVYSHRSNQLPTLRNRVFNLCFCATFCAMVTNILSTLAIYHIDAVPIIVTQLITGAYFFATPLMGGVYFAYVVACVYEDEARALQVCFFGMIPAEIYLILLLLNPWTHALFSIDSVNGYMQGSLIATTYLIFYLYCVFCIGIALIRRNRVDVMTLRLLASFPILATVVILIQQRFPSIILSGSAATCALLMIYLYLQNKQISMDYLTGLGNRGEFLKRIDLQLRKHREIPFTLVVLSLRNFRQINNKWGQTTGDSYLKVIASYLKTVVNSQYIYRFGGDEFAILLPKPQEAAVRRLICALDQRMSEPWSTEIGSCLIPGVFGVINYPDSADSTEVLIDGIEYAVHIAKQQKESNVHYCNWDTIASIRRQRQIVEILQHSLEHDSFEVYFQPIYSVKKQRFVHAEGLLRLNHSPLGPLSPGEMIPIAEDTGLIVEITYLVLKKVCAFLRRVVDEGLDIEGVSFNLSAIQFEQPDLAERIIEIIKQSGAPFEMVKIEITESMLAENTQAVEDFMTRMHSLGVQIGLDDFGTGYSNLRSVIETPMDVVKFDKSLLHLAMETEKAHHVISQMASIFNQMGVRLLIEGVETPEQNAFAVGAGFDLIQGFWYARPMPGEDALRILGKGFEVLSTNAAH